MPIPLIDAAWRFTSHGQVSVCGMIWTLGLAALLTSSPVSAMDSPQVSFSVPDAAAFNWEAQQEMHLSGIPVVWRSFTAPLPLEKAAELLGASTDRFQRVMAFKDSIMLSGTNVEWNWVAELQRTPGGVTGRVSALHIRTDQVRQALDKRASSVFSWVPRQAQLRFTHTSPFYEVTTLQQLYSVNLRADELNAYVKRQLKQAGWHDETSSTGLPSASVWSRKTTRLIFMVQEQGGHSSSLFVHYFE